MLVFPFFYLTSNHVVSLALKFLILSLSILQLAISMVTKAASLARDLKSIKSDLCFMQERCGLLEEENRRLRDGFTKGIRPEEDDLVSFLFT